MMRRARFFSISLIGLALAACATPQEAFQKEHYKPVSIAEIKENPGRWLNQPLELTGKVKVTSSRLPYAYFLMEDSTGEIDVISDKPLPSKGETITMTGVVDDAFFPRVVLRERSPDPCLPTRPPLALPCLPLQGARTAQLRMKF